jgi:DNA repair protein RecN (Recombination protein N)
MPHARFVCDEITTDGVTFLFSANAGIAPRALTHIISGGEMSRFMLAVKCVTPKTAPSTLVFDEIDTGISGIMGHKIAEKMVKIAAATQVIVVTHLAQIAAHAKQHFQIAKFESNGTTSTTVTQLDAAAAKKELTRMVGGEEFMAKVLTNPIR